MEEFILTSVAFTHGKQIPSRFTCDGENISPPLSIRGAPKEAKSLVLIMEDPDVPTHLREDGMWDHWVKFNIPPDTKDIPEGTEPAGISGKGTSGNLAYHGPCPPDREHRYIFMVYALDITLDLREGVSKEAVKTAMHGHILDRAELIGLYARS